MQPYYEAGGVTIYHGDCREVLPRLSRIGLVATDPPYTLGMQHVEGKVGWGDLMNSASFYAGVLSDCRKLVENQRGAVWLFTSWRAFPVIMRASFEVPWKIESLLVWDKCWIGPGGPNGLRPSYELIALFASPGFRIDDRGLPDIWRHPYSSARSNGHAAEKPIALMTALLVAGGDGTVLDPFMGSGTTLVAAKNLGRRAIGIEIEERYCEIAATRLSQEVLAL